MELVPPAPPAAPPSAAPLRAAAVAPRYHIEDEPRPRGLARFAVQPLWPLLAIMFGGSWLSWPWSVFNGWVIGSPTLKKEAAWAAGGFAGRAGLTLALLWADTHGLISPAAVPFAIIPLTLWTLAVSYAINALQGRTFQLYEHYGGPVSNGLLVILAGFAVRQAVAQSAAAGLLFLFLG